MWVCIGCVTMCWCLIIVDLGLSRGSLCVVVYWFVVGLMTRWVLCYEVCCGCCCFVWLVAYLLVGFVVGLVVCRLYC